MPKGKTAAPAPAKATPDLKPSVARKEAQDARHRDNLASDEPSPWQYAKALRAERRKGLPMSEISRIEKQRREKADEVYAEQNAKRVAKGADKSSPSQAARNARLMAEAMDKAKATA